MYLLPVNPLIMEDAVDVSNEFIIVILGDCLPAGTAATALLEAPPPLLVVKRLDFKVVLDFEFSFSASGVTTAGGTTTFLSTESMTVSSCKPRPTFFVVLPRMLRVV
jgi:hypothetical protein